MSEPQRPQSSHKLHAHISAAPRKRKKQKSPFAPSSTSNYLFPEGQSLSPVLETEITFAYFCTPLAFSTRTPSAFISTRHLWSFLCLPGGCLVCRIGGGLSISLLQDLACSSHSTQCSGDPIDSHGFTAISVLTCSPGLSPKLQTH